MTDPTSDAAKQAAASATAEDAPGLHQLDESALDAIIADHQAWLKSDGQEGVRAGLDETDLRRAKLMDCDLSDLSATGADLRKADLTRAKLRGADLRDADLRRATLYRADLRGADLRRANLEGASLRHAELEGARLRRAQLAHSDLRYAELVGANLSEARGLSDASLQGADLTDAVGLLGGEFAGMDLGGTRLPADIAGFTALEQIASLSQHARNVFLAMLAACVFSWLTVATTTDAALLGNSATSPLPIIQTPVPIAGFYWAAPLILLTLFFYLHIYLQRLWEGLASLPAVFPDGRSLDQRAYPWLLSGLVQAYVPLLRKQRPALSSLQVGLSILAAWVLVPGTMFLFWIRYLPRHELWGTLILIACLMTSIIGGIAFFRRARATLMSRDLASVLREPTLEPVTLFATLLVTLSFSAAAIFGNGMLLGFDLNADLREAEVSERPVTWTGRDDTVKDELTQVKGASMRGADLRNAEAERAYLVRADLREADLRGANLRGAVLVGALFKGARLEGAFFRSSDLRHAELAGATLTRLRFSRADLSNAQLGNADLQGAGFVGAKLDGARLHGAWLRNASFENATALGADLTHAKLGNASLREASFVEADFRNASMNQATLLLADLRGADLEGASLRDASLWGTDFSGANLAETDLEGAQFYCSIMRLGFVCTNLSGADLATARGLTRYNLENACGNDSTKLPPDLADHRFRPCKPLDR